MELPQSPPAWLALQLGQRATVISGMTEHWSASQAMIELYEGGPTGHGTLLHLIEVTRTTLAALDLEPPFLGKDETWDQLQTQFRDVAQCLSEQVSTLSLEALEAPPAIDIVADFKDSLTTRHAFLLGHIFHLAYHAGQLGSLAVRTKNSQGDSA